MQVPKKSLACFVLLVRERDATPYFGEWVLIIACFLPSLEKRQHTHPLSSFEISAAPIRSSSVITNVVVFCLQHPAGQHFSCLKGIHSRTGQESLSV